eukprot:GHVL01023695.1.p2 GENE.GHVL01023695.1~~GHVL01023695.1.p2  ORF type:complete len:333 (-),score=41.98 GHVL01023695.1:1088-2086(-)
MDVSSVFYTDDMHVIDYNSLIIGRSECEILRQSNKRSHQSSKKIINEEVGNIEPRFDALAFVSAVLNHLLTNQTVDGSRFCEHLRQCAEEQVDIDLRDLQTANALDNLNQRKYQLEQEQKWMKNRKNQIVSEVDKSWRNQKDHPRVVRHAIHRALRKFPFTTSAAHNSKHQHKHNSPPRATTKNSSTNIISDCPVEMSENNPVNISSKLSEVNYSSADVFNGECTVTRMEDIVRREIEQNCSRMLKIDDSLWHDGVTWDHTPEGSKCVILKERFHKPLQPTERAALDLKDCYLQMVATYYSGDTVESSDTPLCFFHLMGTCQDTECRLMHLR